MKIKKQSHMVLCLLVFLLLWSQQLVPQPTAPNLSRVEESLEKILGTQASWKPLVLESLKWGMTCEEAKKIFPALVCNNWKQYDFPKIPGKPLSSVDEYQFTFKNGKLEGVTIVFNVRLFDAQAFKEAILNVTQKKWGALPSTQLSQPKKNWYNADRDVVSLSYTANHWQLLVQMPRREAGQIATNALAEAEIRAYLNQLLGSSNTWNIPVFAKFKYGMYCGQVQEIYKTLSGCDPSKAWSFGMVTINGHPMVQALKFAFNRGQLANASIIFHPQLDRTLFKNVSLDLIEQKWGRIDLNKRNNDALSLYKEGFGYVQRNFYADHWEIKVDLSK